MIDEKSEAQRGDFKPACQVLQWGAWDLNQEQSAFGAQPPLFRDTLSLQPHRCKGCSCNRVGPELPWGKPQRTGA